MQYCEIKIYFAFATRRKREQFVDRKATEAQNTLNNLATNLGWRELDLQLGGNHVAGSVIIRPDQSAAAAITAMKKALIPVLQGEFAGAVWTRNYIAATRPLSSEEISLFIQRQPNI